MANQDVCLLLAVQRVRYQICMLTDLRFDWLSRAEHLGQGGRSRDELNFSRIVRADEEETFRPLKRVVLYFSIRERNISGEQASSLKFLPFYSKEACTNPGSFGRGNSLNHALVPGTGSTLTRHDIPSDQPWRAGRDDISTGCEDCDMCRACDTHHSSRWPQCCQHNSMCCSQLAAACQHCDKHDLINFCNKHFKRKLIVTAQSPDLGFILSELIREECETRNATS
uniref:Uncharacterized protein n=1 Tax=Timema poppense TaxID=170557 RepID=A0A7R9H1H3_TIMPO|nr:unnamed protein product [Timema poppensis]